MSSKSIASPTLAIGQPARGPVATRPEIEAPQSSASSGWLCRRVSDSSRSALRPQAAAFEEPGDTTVNALGYAGHFGIAGRGCLVEANVAHFVLSVDAIERQQMEMDFKIEGIAEALDEGHGTTPDRSIRGGKACPAAQRAE